MSSSWKPSLQAAKSCTAPNLDERPTEGQSVNAHRTWSDIYLASNASVAPVRTGRTWGSKKAAKAPIQVVPEQMVQETVCGPPSYGKVEFLLMRQCMMDAGRIEQPVRGSRLMCRETPSSEASPSVCRSTKLSTGSMCSTSTIDTLSDTSDEPDGASSSSFDLTLSSVGPPPGLQACLRVNAPEFVPSNLWSAEPQCPATALDALAFAPVLPGPFLGTTPLVSITEIAGGLRWEEAPWHSIAGVDFCDDGLHHMKHPGTYTAAELLQAADRRTHEWRQYCGLAPLNCEGFPQSYVY